jgi:hypothetical protein
MALLNSLFRVTLSLLCLGSISLSRSKAAELRIETPVQLLDKFYESLLSEEATDFPPIFHEPTAFAPALPGASALLGKSFSASTEAAWKYLRQNKKLFLFSAIEPSRTTQRSRLTYVFTAFPNASTFFDGAFCVELEAPLSIGGNEGIIKQILFPLEKNLDPTGPRYRINVSVIRINGILLDPGNRFDRSGNFYEQLGIVVGKGSIIEK